jgi:hypothetical protein
MLLAAGGGSLGPAILPGGTTPRSPPGSLAFGFAHFLGRLAFGFGWGARLRLWLGCSPSALVGVLAFGFGWGARLRLCVLSLPWRDCGSAPGPALSPGPLPVLLLAPVLFPVSVLVLVLLPVPPPFARSPSARAFTTALTRFCSPRLFGSATATACVSVWGRAVAVATGSAPAPPAAAGGGVWWRSWSIGFGFGGSGWGLFGGLGEAAAGEKFWGYCYVVDGFSFVPGA